MISDRQLYTMISKGQLYTMISDGSVSIHERNIKILAIEMFEVSKTLVPLQMDEIFK